MLVRVSLVLILVSVFAGAFAARPRARVHDHHQLHHRSSSLNSNDSSVANFKFPEHMSFNSVSSSTTTGCSHTERIDTNLNGDDDDGHFDEIKPSKQKVKLQLKHRSTGQETGLKQYVIVSRAMDLSRIQMLHRRIIEKKNQNTISRLNKESQKQNKQIKPLSAARQASSKSYPNGVSGS